MQSKILSKRTLLIVALTGLAFSPALFSDFIQQSLNLPNGKQVQQEQVSSGLPIRLKIPKLNVDSAVEYVGLTPDGVMDVPKERANVAWFNLGPPPGENGSAVLAGHYGWKNGKASVFDNLYKLRKGDKLYIENDKGEIISFVVRESRRYDPEADATEVFGSSDGKAHLNLVTCEAWDEVSKTYSKRLVVFTDKE
ncbi:MAG: class F sortase [bacterium]|nr:class F sortase [bacterium]